MDRAVTIKFIPLGCGVVVHARYFPMQALHKDLVAEGSELVAFEDIGPYLVTQHNRPDVVESMVDMVKAKSWERILVSGHEAFRREVWLQATLFGLQVSGYEPKAADLARLGEGRRELTNNRVAYAGGEPAHESPADAGGDSPAVSRAPGRGRPGDVPDSQRGMQMAVLVAAMRAQGFSDRSIVRVEQHAGKLYDTFRAEGLRVPTPRVFDPKAPSARSRAGRPAHERPAAREVEHEVGHEVERTPSGPEQPSL